jgi:type IV pilus assembly protein PilF
MRFLCFLSLFIVGCTAPTQQLYGRADARIALGIKYLDMGNMVKAKFNLMSAQKHAPSYYKVTLALAHYYEKVNESKLASNLFKQALEKEPNNGEILNNFAKFLCNRGHYEQAKTLFAKATRQLEYLHTALSYENAALCALKYKDIQSAAKLFNKALNHDPNRTKSTLNLAKIDIANGKTQQAKVRLASLLGVDVKSRRISEILNQLAMSKDPKD